VLAVYGHRPDEVVVLTVDINEPQIHGGFLRCYTLGFGSQKPRHEESGLTTESGFNFRRKDETSFDDVGDGVRVVLAFEGSDSCHEFVDGDAKSPDIYKFIIAAAFEHLWSPIVGSSCESEHISFDSSFDEFFADSEVDKFDASLVGIVENVLRFDVAVADLVRVHVDQRLDHLVHDFLQLLDQEESTCSDLIGTAKRSG
jgi:hypothetical protein